MFDRQGRRAWLEFSPALAGLPPNKLKLELQHANKLSALHFDSERYHLQVACVLLS